jgi:hypothetical protein
MKAGIEDVIHGDHIRKVSLVIGDKEHSSIRERTDDLGAFYL